MIAFDGFHCLHGAVVATLAVVHAWAWYRRGFWVPRYVHFIALGALISGIAVSATLPRPSNPDPVIQWSFPLIFPSILVVATYTIAVVLGLLDMAGMSDPKSKIITQLIKIIAVPDGSSPKEVRQAWVGAVLPLAFGENLPRIRYTKPGIGEWIRSWFLPRLYYTVSVDDALVVLEKASPNSARWWRKNCPDIVGTGHVFLFVIEDCEPIP